jgi:hypothetical protein
MLITVAAPPRLRHEPCSPARTLGSWVRIPLEAWMFVCVYSVCVVLCIGSGLVTGWSPSKESYRMCIDQETGKAAKVHKGDGWMDGRTDIICHVDNPQLFRLHMELALREEYLLKCFMKLITVICLDITAVNFIAHFVNRYSDSFHWRGSGRRMLSVELYLYFGV